MTLPNYITLFRILLAPFFFTALVYYEPGKEYYRQAAFIIFVVATATDALDGFIARVTRRQTDLGRFLDPLADKLILLSGFVGILVVDALAYRPPLWVTITIVFRDMVIVIGIIVLYLVSGTVRIHPNLLGKATTAFQMLTLIAILMEWEVSRLLCYITAGLTITSLLSYIVRDLKRLNLVSM